MDIKELKLAYATTDNIKKMGIEIPQEILEKTKSLEEQYLKETVLPAISDFAKPLLEPLQSTMLSISINKEEDDIYSKLLFCNTPFLQYAWNKEQKVIEEDDLVDKDEDDEDEIYFYAQIFDNNYRIVETEEEIEIDSSNHYQGRITFSLSDCRDNYYIFRLYEDGTVTNISIREMMKRPHNTDYVLPWKYVAASPVMTLFDLGDSTIYIYYEDTKKWHLVKFIKLTTILKMNSWEKIVPDGYKILSVGFVPDNILRNLKVAEKASETGTLVYDGNKKLCNFLKTNIMPGEWEELKAQNIHYTQMGDHSSQGSKLNTGYLDGVIKEYETKDFFVVFDNKKVVVSYNGSDTMVQAINEMLKRTTFNKLKEVNISVDTQPLFMQRPVVVGRASFHELSNGWWVNTHMNNATKKQYLEDLARHCGINLKVILNMKKK